MIRNILFDIGVVLLHLDYRPAMERMLPLCDPARRLNAQKFLTLVERDPMMAEYERGRVAPDDFFRHFVGLTGFRGTYEQFSEIWFDILSENKPMIEFARELSRAYSCYLVTNAGVIHIPRLYRTFKALDFHTDEAASCDLGEVKPDRAFYEKALAKFGIAADTCLLVDDRPENVDGARACGIRAVHYTNAAETIAAVRAELGRDK
jgi:HAD superfamily hydrolase (TIGR01509 family)